MKNNTIKIYHQKDGKLELTVSTQDKQLNIENIVKIKPIINLLDYFQFSHISYEQIVDIFKELGIILDTHLSLNEAIEILLKGNYDKKINTILNTIKTAQENGQQVSKALEIHKKQLGVLPILFFDLGFKNSNIKDSVKALNIILKEGQEAKKKFVDALSYPLILTITFCISIILIFEFVLPKFKHIFIQFGDNLPIATKYLLNVKSFLDSYLLVILCLIPIAYFGIKYYRMMYKKNIDKFLILHIPLISSLYKDFVLYRFFLSLGMLIRSSYQFQIALESTKLIVENSFIEYKIERILDDIKNGVSVSKAFENTKLFNIITIRLLHTAQQTNTMQLILDNIIDIYKQRLTKNIKNFSTAIGPIFIMIISSFILWLVFALMIPIWDLSKVLK